MLQISDKLGAGAFPIEWDQLPKEVLEGVKDSRIDVILMCPPDGNMFFTNAIYFRQVKRFRKGVKLIEYNEYTFGV